MRAFAFMALLTLPSFGQLCGPDWGPTGFSSALSAAVACGVVFDDGTGPKLYVGGSFGATNGIPSAGVAAWDGTTWLSVGGGLAGGSVTALCVHDDGTGPALYASGWFSGAVGNFVSKLIGGLWSPVGPGFDNGATALASYNDGTGLALYCGGWFSATNDNTVLLNHIAKWNGTTWAPVGTGVGGGMSAMAVFNGALYLSGGFTNAGGVAATNIAKYNGVYSNIGNASSSVGQFTVYNDGSGAALYAGGFFTTIGGVPASRVAKYDGTAWTALGGGVAGNCFAVAGFDDGTGPALYAAGTFLTAGGNNCTRLAKYSGGTWSAVNGGLSGAGQMLQVFPSVYGNRLAVGGSFAAVGPAGALPFFNLGFWGPTPPYIVTQPTVSQTVNAGTPVTLSVTAGGAGDTYQWRHYFGPISGATNSTYSIASAGPLDWGFYDCVVTNGCGSTTSALSTLTLNPAFALAMTQPFGSMSLFLTHNSPTQPGVGYFTTFSFDPLNSSMPGQGPWCGEWTTINDIITQFLYGFPPFQGVLNGSGNATFVLGAGGIPPFLFNATVTIVSCTFSNALVVLNNSNVVTLTLQ